MNADPWKLQNPPTWDRLRVALNGLQFKATAIFAIILAMITGVVWWVTVENSWRLANRLEREQAIQHAKMTSVLAAKALRAGNEHALQTLADQFVTGDPIWFLYVTSPDGKILAYSDRAGTHSQSAKLTRPAHRLPVGIPLPAVLPDGLGRYLSVTYPIHINDFFDIPTGHDVTANNALGYVHLGVDRNQTIAEFDAAADLAVGVAVALVLCAIPIAFLVVRRITAPLNEMSRAAQRFSEGDYNARVRPDREDEIGSLARSFNHLAGEVTRKHNEIVTLNEQLEARVLERTSQLRDLAMRDPLTCLYNRRHFSDALERRMSEAKRYGVDLAIMMIDLDNFKKVNDDFGHQAGDDVLVIAAGAIVAQLRAADVAARYGGDEFIVLMPHSTEAHARALSDRIRREFASLLADKLPGADVTLSAGIATLSSNIDSADDFIRDADRALYAAKERGKNQIATGTE